MRTGTALRILLIGLLRGGHGFLLAADAVEYLVDAFVEVEVLVVLLAVLDLLLGVVEHLLDSLLLDVLDLHAVHDCALVLLEQRE